MKHQEAIIESIVLQKTNAIWNKCRVNHPWSVGYTSYLIAEQSFQKFDNWITHYFTSGDKREIKIDLLKNKEIRDLLRSPIISKTEMRRFQKMPKFKKLNLESGRSWEAVEKRVLYFQQALAETSIIYTYNECAKIFMQRVLFDTWNGHVREYNTVSQLNRQFPDFEFFPSDAFSDYNFGIDFKVLKNQRLVAAIQIKPISFRGKKGYITTAKKANEKKWMRFEKEKDVKVFLILSDQNGIIQEENGFYDFLKTC